MLFSICSYSQDTLIASHFFQGINYFMNSDYLVNRGIQSLESTVELKGERFVIEQLVFDSNGETSVIKDWYGSKVLLDDSLILQTYDDTLICTRLSSELLDVEGDSCFITSRKWKEGGKHYSVDTYTTPKERRRKEAKFVAIFGTSAPKWDYPEDLKMGKWFPDSRTETTVTSRKRSEVFIDFIYKDNVKIEIETNRKGRIKSYIYREADWEIQVKFNSKGAPLSVTRRDEDHSVFNQLEFQYEQGIPVSYTIYDGYSKEVSTPVRIEVTYW